MTPTVSNETECVAPGDAHVEHPAKGADNAPPGPQNTMPTIRTNPSEVLNPHILEDSLVALFQVLPLAPTINALALACHRVSLLVPDTREKRVWRRLSTAVARAVKGRRGGR
jgi:hypothetical protein